MDKFWITKQLGGGSFGTVFEAQHQPTGEVVAVKYLRETFSSFEQCLNLPEVQSLSKLRHPNIVQLKDVIFENDSAFLVFEYMQSSLLDLMMKRRTKFTEEEVRSICFQMFQGLAYMHRNGYFHRDLKPANVLVKDGSRFSSSPLSVLVKTSAVLGAILTIGCSKIWVFSGYLERRSSEFRGAIVSKSGDCVSLWVLWFDLLEFD
nr:cyclin-dependent kinase F-4-like [Malus domestica]